MDTDGTTTASAQMTRIRRMKRVSSSSSSSLDRGRDGAAESYAHERGRGIAND